MINKDIDRNYFIEQFNKRHNLREHLLDYIDEHIQNSVCWIGDFMVVLEDSYNGDITIIDSTSFGCGEEIKAINWYKPSHIGRCLIVHNMYKYELITFLDELELDLSTFL